MQGLCLNHPTLGPDAWTTNRASTLRRARAVCVVCPSKEDCLAGALADVDKGLTLRGMYAGVWFGPNKMCAAEGCGLPVPGSRGLSAGSDYCSSQCEPLGLPRMRVAQSLDCGVCGQRFKPAHIKHYYCSKPCKRKAEAARRRAYIERVPGADS